MDKFVTPAPPITSARLKAALQAATGLTGVDVTPAATSSDTSTASVVPAPPPQPTAGGSGIKRKPVRGRYYY